MMANRRTYHAHVLYELVCCTLKDKCLTPGMKSLVRDIEDLNNVRDAMDMCFDQSKKYVAEAL
jgi:hypothetical protein